jgi:hypothetical protein
MCVLLIIGLGASQDVGVRKFLEGKGRAARILGDEWVDGWIACSLILHVCGVSVVCLGF